MPGSLCAKGFQTSVFIRNTWRTGAAISFPAAAPGDEDSMV
jgi:hypothetical protein